MIIVKELRKELKNIFVRIKERIVREFGKNCVKIKELLYKN
jgi:hypothetical protein